MDKKTMGNWIMYHEIHRLAREGLSNSAIARYAVCDRRTIAKYLSMSELEYEEFLMRQDNRQKILDKYEDFVKERLIAYPAASAAQMFDWLKENRILTPQTMYTNNQSFSQICFSEAILNTPLFFRKKSCQTCFKECLWCFTIYRH